MLCIPPPLPLVVLPEIVVSFIATIEPPLTSIPPPKPPPLLFEITELSIFEVDPRNNANPDALESAEFLLISTLLRLRVEETLVIAPPVASVTLFVTILLVRFNSLSTRRIAPPLLTTVSPVLPPLKLRLFNVTFVIAAPAGVLII